MLNKNYSNFLDDTTFVIQGPVSIETDKVICNIRNNFSPCKIIVSTWEGQLYENDNVDEVVYSIDPGSIFYNNKNLLNYERQRVSSLAGIRQVDTKYVVKIRSDILLRSEKLLQNYFNYNLDKKLIPTIFRAKVGILNFTTYHSINGINSPFHYCDWIYIGLKEDVQNFFEEPWLKEEDNLKVGGNYNANFPNDSFSNHVLFRNETSFVLAALRRNGVVLNIKHSFDQSDELNQFSINLLESDFIVLDSINVGVKSLKYPFYTFSMCGSVVATGASFIYRFFHKYKVTRYCFYSFCKSIFSKVYSR